MRWKVAFLLAVAVALGLIGYTLIGPGGGNKEANLNAELDRLMRDNQLLAAQNHRMALEVEALQQRNDYIEKVARDELGLVKRDEVVIHLTEVPADERPDAGSARDAGGGP